MGYKEQALRALQTEDVKQVFRNILRSRTISRYQLEAENPSQKEKINRALDSLEQAGLIEKATGQSQEKDRFFPSGSGLIMEKFVK